MSIWAGCSQHHSSPNSKAQGVTGYLGIMIGIGQGLTATAVNDAAGGPAAADQTHPRANLQPPPVPVPSPPPPSPLQPTRTKLDVRKFMDFAKWGRRRPLACGKCNRKCVHDSRGPGRSGARLGEDREVCAHLACMPTGGATAAFAHAMKSAGGQPATCQVHPHAWQGVARWCFRAPGHVGLAAALGGLALGQSQRLG